MPVPLAIGWTIVALMLFLLAHALTVTVRPSIGGDLVNSTTCLALAYVLVVMAILRIHMPGRELSDALGFRKAGVAMICLGVLAGVLMQAPANAIEALIETKWPREQPVLADLAEAMRTAPIWHKVATAMAAVVIGPAAEEVLFRGAMFRSLRLGAATWVSLATTAMLFSVSHADEREMLPIFVCGLVLGGLRWISGSTIVSLSAHAAFNAVSVFELMTIGAGDDSKYPWVYGLGGTAGLAAVLALTAWLAGRNADALAAREEDLR